MLTRANCTTDNLIEIWQSISYSDKEEFESRQGMLGPRPMGTYLACLIGDSFSHPARMLPMVLSQHPYKLIHRVLTLIISKRSHLCVVKDSNKVWCWQQWFRKREMDRRTNPGCWLEYLTRGKRKRAKQTKSGRWPSEAGKKTLLLEVWEEINISYAKYYPILHP